MFLICNADSNKHLYSALTAIPYEGVKIREKGLKINRKDPPHTKHNTIVQGRRKVWKSGVWASTNPRPFEWEGFASIPSKIQSPS